MIMKWFDDILHKGEYTETALLLLLYVYSFNTYYTED